MITKLLILFTADMSPEPSPQKKRKKAKGKTRGIPDDVVGRRIDVEEAF